MKKLFVMVALGLLVLAASCDTKNIGNTPFPTRGPIVTVSVPAGMNGGADAVWTVTWVSGTAPFTITMNMGGGATPNTFTQAGVTSPFTHTFTMVNPSLTDNATYNYTVTVTDGQGLGRDWTGSYTVGPTLNQPPTVSATYAAGVVTATVGDPDGDALTVTSAATGTLTVAPASQNATAPYAALTFSVSADLLAGGTGDVTITVDDSHNAPVSDTVAGITIAGFTPAADTLYAIPTANASSVGTPVTVVILTGNTANNFLYMNGVGVTVQGAVDAANAFIQASGAYYEANSFNVGAPGGARDASDGIWAALGSTSFILAPDNLMNRGTDIGGGRVRLDFNVTPLDGTQSNSTSGALFNFGLNFGVAGTYTLGFEEFNVVKRTYYSDAGATEYNWGTLMADATGALNAAVTGVNNAIVVN